MMHSIADFRSVPNTRKPMLVWYRNCVGCAPQGYCPHENRQYFCIECRICDDDIPWEDENPWSQSEVMDHARVHYLTHHAGMPKF